MIMFLMDVKRLERERERGVIVLIILIVLVRRTFYERLKMTF